MEDSKTKTRTSEQYSDSEMFLCRIGFHKMQREERTEKWVNHPSYLETCVRCGHRCIIDPMAGW